MVDCAAATRRLEALADIPVLPLNESFVKLSKVLIQEGGLPTKALDDALHIAFSAVHGMDYLLSNSQQITPQFFRNTI